MSYATDTAIARSKPIKRVTSATQRRASRHRTSPEEVLAHYLKRVDPEVAASFTEPQREAIKSMLGARGMTKHAVEVRHSIPFGKRSLYFVCLIGKEGRSLHRIYRESAVSKPLNVVFYLCVAALVSAPVLGMMLALGL